MVAPCTLPFICLGATILHHLRERCKQFFVVDKAALLLVGPWVARHGRAGGWLSHPWHKAGSKVGSAPWQFPPMGCQALGRGTRGNCRRSYTLRGMGIEGRGRGRPLEGMKKQGAGVLASCLFGFRVRLCVGWVLPYQYPPSARGVLFTLLVRPPCPRPQTASARGRGRVPPLGSARPASAIPPSGAGWGSSGAAGF